MVPKKKIRLNVPKSQDTKCLFLIPKSCPEKSRCISALENIKSFVHILTKTPTGRSQNKKYLAIVFVQSYHGDDIEEMEKCLNFFEEYTVVVPASLVTSKKWIQSLIPSSKKQLIEMLRAHMLSQVEAKLVGSDALKMPMNPVPAGAEGIGEIPQTLEKFDSVKSHRHTEFLWDHITVRPVGLVSESHVGYISKMLEAFYGLNVKVAEKCGVEKVRNTLRLTCKIKMKDKKCRVRILRGIKSNLDSEVLVDDLDMVVKTENFRPRKALLQVVVTDLSLQQATLLGKYEEPVLGRATGDGTAVITTSDYDSFQTKESLYSMLVTTVHESLHTLGLHHCTVFECVMNASHGTGSYGTVIACPVCEGKLIRIFGAQSTKQKLTRLKAFMQNIRWKTEEKKITTVLKKVTKK